MNFKELLQSIVERYEGSVGTLHKYELSERLLYMVAHVGDLPEFVIKETKKAVLGKGVAGTTALLKKPTAIKNLATTRSTIPVPRARSIGIVGMICVPIFHYEEMVGTLGIGYPTERDFTENEIQEVQEIANSLAEELKLLNVSAITD